jgi:hypothetical protein
MHVSCPKEFYPRGSSANSNEVLQQRAKILINECFVVTTMHSKAFSKDLKILRVDAKAHFA